MALVPLALILCFTLGTDGIDPIDVAGFNTLGFSNQVIKGLPKFETQGNVKEEKGVHGNAMYLEQKGDFKTDASCIVAPSVSSKCPFAFDHCVKGVTIALWVFIKPLKGECGTLFSLGDGHVSFTHGAGEERKMVLNIALNDQMTSCFCSEKEWESQFLNKWVHLTFVTNPGSKDKPLKVYINGKTLPLEGPKCYQFKDYPLADLPNMFIGCRSSAFAGSDRGVCGFNGLIDEFQVFVGELDGDQVKKLANENKPNQDSP